MRHPAITSLSLRPDRRYVAGITLATILVAATLLSSPAWSQSATGNYSGSASSDVSWLSGGVGDEARDEMRRAASAYNVHLLFTTSSGAYLASVPFSVAGSGGQQIYSGVSDGPMLYLKLKPGSYQISAEIDGTMQSRRVRVGNASSATKISFVSRAQ